MAFLRVSVSVVALAGLGAASMEAQSTRAHVIAAPQGRPRVASIAPPPPPPRALNTNGQTVFQNDPIFVTPDGQVFIDLGNGYEPVARTCPYAYGYDCQSYGQPTYAPPSYDPPAYAAPVYPTPTYPPGGAYRCYPSCIEPSRSAAGSPAIPSAKGLQSAARAPAARTTIAPRVVRR